MMRTLLDYGGFLLACLLVFSPLWVPLALGFILLGMLL